MNAAVVMGPEGGSAEARSVTWKAEAETRAWRASVFTDIWSASAKSDKWTTEIESVIRVGGELYEGDYDVVPTHERQTLQTRGRTLAEDIVVAPIPSNYGLITWDGSTLTVS